MSYKSTMMNPTKKSINLDALDVLPKYFFGKITHYDEFWIVWSYKYENDNHAVK